MTTIAKQFSARLDAACTSLALDLSEDTKEKLLNYIVQLAKWNKTYNLTALRDPEQMLIQHVFDSLSVVPAFRSYFAQRGVNSPTIVDVGAGAGLPGAVLAICNPTWQVVCVDAVEKKTAFVQQVAAVLRVPNLRSEHRRIEVEPLYEADVVTSRAFASLVDFVNLAAHHVKQGAEMLAMKGKQPDDEISQLLETDWEVKQILPLTVPELDAQRCLVYLHRKN